MPDPLTTITASTIATLAFQKFIESGAGELVKKFTETGIKKMDVLLSFDTLLVVLTYGGEDR